MCQDNLTPGNNSRKTHINVKEPEPRCSADRPPRVGLICGEKGLSSCLHLPSVHSGGCDGATSHAHARTHTEGETGGCILTDTGPVRETNSWKAGNNVGYVTKKKAHTVVGQVRSCLSARLVRVLCFALCNTHVQS